MSTATERGTDRISSPLAMGAIAALGSLGIALAVCVIPALAAQLAARHSGLSVLSAILLGIDAVILGHGGSLLLNGGGLDGGVRLMPLGLTLVLVLVAAGAMRRMGRALSLVTSDGALREGALRDAATALGAFVLVYALGGGFFSALSRTATVHALSSTAVLSFGLVALVGGAAGLLWALRRRESPGVPAVRILDLLPSPFDAAARGASISILGLCTAGMLTAIGFLIVGFGHAGAIADRLAPGVVGGIVLTLLQLALLPTFALWTLAALLGGRFTVGVGTAISLGSSAPGVLPAVPVLAALPAPGRGPWFAWLLLLLPLGATVAGALRVVRDVSDQDLRRRATAWGAYALATIIGTLLIESLAIGGIGSGRLRDLGPVLGSIVLPLIGIVVGTLGIAILAADRAVVSRGRDAVAVLRERVERSEEVERGERSGDGIRDARSDPGSVHTSRTKSTSRTGHRAAAARDDVAPDVPAEPDQSVEPESPDDEVSPRAGS